MLRDLPDREGARRFHEQLAAEHTRVARKLADDPGLLSDALALAAWSPLLATTLAQHPDHLGWLARERAERHVRSTEELQESLARFALTHSSEAPHVMFARFRRRELLRIYLHDIRRTASVVETTEELSNLADAVLAYALNLARQELDNLYGSPLTRDERGRTTQASFCIIALGKLGSRELNYSSDIDLLFLYSEDGQTSGAGTRAATTNREYFNRLAERIARLTGQQAGEGAAYRVDLRLRPHGRDGALAVSLSEAARYYQETAHAWELQALLRARASAGSNELFARFYESVRPRVYSHAGSVAQALSNVRLAKQKIDRQHNDEGRGYNVKLGRGGVREIEFVAQALQLAHGARDPWLHAPHTLISLGRLADRSLINERERTELSDAYDFLRTLEHRLQMEHGLQTHTVPDATERRDTLARRMNFTGDDALTDFDRALEHHTARVRAAFERVFNSPDDNAHTEDARTQARVDDATPASDETTSRSSNLIATPSSTLIESSSSSSSSYEEAERLALNPRRARLFLARIRASVEKSDARVELSSEKFASVARLCGASEYFGEMIASNPELIDALNTCEQTDARDFRSVLRAEIDGEKNFRDELKALRRAWSRLIVGVGARDAAGEIDLAASNRLQTGLATASINAALLVARRELARRYGGFAAGPRLAVLALGRLASGGMDYGSDLDIVAVHDPRVRAPVASLTREQSYARLCELMTNALSSLTREGHLYRVDLRLRPDGKNGALAPGAEAFIEYLRTRTQAWEWLAYVKLRAVAGDLELGRAIEQRARRAIHEAALKCGGEELRRETRRVRERLERERGARVSHSIDIKFGAGGMLDVYFAARYLQLRDDVRDEGEDRSTRATLARLQERGSLDAATYAALSLGYATLRSLDHSLRLVAGRTARLPSAHDHPLVADLARALSLESPAALIETLRARMTEVRAAYERVTG
ncbi:MAG: [glutamine synthetase] adenylyltransferase / [glutamine synthetase]-adenylyl-L-tyrosine [Acidobacteriota bacterium]|nr:[glutamine synthetase] adenylyltransferase / [glutamine synthetase]-adenylyl-L-tyrosine [Acidobacteriota bacterium]